MKELQDRIFLAKRFLNTEMTHCKLQDGQAQLELRQIINHLDIIREVERTGLRRLEDVQSVKIERVLTSVETVMSLSKN
ncbi:MAG: hypothetical protein ACK5XP_09680 [Sphingobacteriia bacterium]